MANKLYLMHITNTRIFTLIFYLLYQKTSRTRINFRPIHPKFYRFMFNLLLANTNSLEQFCGFDRWSRLELSSSRTALAAQPLIWFSRIDQNKKKRTQDISSIGNFVSHPLVFPSRILNMFMRLLYHISRFFCI